MDLLEKYILDKLIWYFQEVIIGRSSTTDKLLQSIQFKMAATPDWT